MNSKVFKDDYKKISLKKWIIISTLSVITVLFLFFIVSLSSSGFNEISLLWRVNKNLLIIIPITGFSLGISSYLIQQMSSNRLADTSILGIGNINLIALMLLIIAVDFNSNYDVNNYKNIYPFLFIIVSMLTTVSIYLLSYNSKKNISRKFIISGLILNFAFIAISYSVNSLLSGGKAAAVKSFANGFLDNSEPLSMYVSLSFFVIALIWLMFIFEKFKICTSNNEIARQLGINTSNVYLQILLISGMLTGVSYILVGNVTFLGLIAGNVAFNIYKKDYKFSIPTSGIVATLILTLTFFFNKNIINSVINTTSIIPIFGIPYFLYLIFKE